jgi:hypothetical protein
MQTKLMFLPEASHVNHTPAQESDSAKKTNAIYGLKCLEQYERLPRVTSWAKTFAALLIGMEGWYSTKCVLTWKILGIKSRPLLYLRARSMRHINENEFGLLPTPTLMDSSKNGDMTGAAKMLMGATQRSSGQQIQKTLTDAIQMQMLKENPALAMELAAKEFVKRTKLPTQMEFVEWIKTLGTKKELATKLNLKLTTVEHWYRMDQVGFSYPSLEDWQTIKMNYTVPVEMDYKMTYQESKEWKGMLPTSTAMDSTNATAHMKSTQVKPGSMHSMTLTRMMSDGMLPTPIKSDCTPARPSKNWQRSDLGGFINKGNTGKILQLNPRFVAEMMGFPANWTELPFQSGETNQ